MTYTIPSYAVRPGSVYQPKSGFPLDFLKTNVVGCWSTRRLLSTGSGNIIRGRDATTNEEDFTAAGYPAGVVTLASGGDAFCPQLYDQSGNANHATQTVAASQPKLVDAGALIVDGSGISGIRFNGDSNTVEVSNASNLSFGNGLIDNPFSLLITTTLNATGSTTGIISKAISSTVGEYYIIIANGTLVFRLVDDSTGGYIGISKIITAVRYNIIVTYNGSGLSSGLKLYLNGVAQTVSSSNSGSYTAMESTVTPVSLGSRGPSSSFYDGDIYAAAVINKNLTESEVAQLNAALA